VPDPEVMARGGELKGHKGAVPLPIIFFEFKSKMTHFCALLALILKFAGQSQKHFLTTLERQ